MLRRLRELAAAGLIRQLDYQLAVVLGELGEQREGVLLAAALVSHGLGRGDVCVDLAAAAATPLFAGEQASSGVPPLIAPDLEPWLAELRDSGFVSDGTVPAPLVLDRRRRLYLGRYHGFEQRLAGWINGRATAPVDAVDRKALERELDRLFPPRPSSGGVDYQRVAAAIAAVHGFCVVSGGPGTGKTTTVTRILALLLRLLGPLRIALAAPTGKAAARLGESLRERKPQLDLEPELLALIPDEVVTLHRLLGMRGDGSRPRYHREEPLHCDLLVVDEASMVDLPLMTRLVDALRDGARLILLGDKDQLASVEAGSVLGDICDSGSEHAYSGRQQALLQGLCGCATRTAAAAPPMADAIALLRHSYRFHAGSGIGELARAVNAGRAEAAVACLSDHRFTDLIWRAAGGAGELAALVSSAADAYAEYLQHSEVADALDAFGRFRLLCALREGPFGIKGLNRMLETELARRGLIDPRRPFYPGRPLMITRNDYSLKLFNGDVGLVWAERRAGGALRAIFPRPDGTLRGHGVARLPPHETVYAMTVHKAQGSEYRRVVLLLPPDPSPVVTRELLYTGLTRAMEQVTLAATEAAVRRALGQRSRRRSGLRERLWG